MAAPSQLLLTAIASAAIVGATLTLRFALRDADEREAAGPPVGAAILSASFATAATDGARGGELEPASIAADASPSPGVERIEVCGLGWVDAEADGSVAPEAILAAPQIAAARARLLYTLRASGELGEAAAIVLGSEASDESAGAPERLLKLATATRDPRVYSLAFRACLGRADDAACAALSAAEWARIDADNAAPWLYLLAQAAAAGDAAAIDDALFHIGAASRDDERILDLAGVVAREAGPLDVDAMAARQTAGRAAAVVFAAMPAYAPLLKTCAGAELRDANRRQACEQAAATLAERSDSIRATRIGSALGRRLGWAEERLDGIDALAQAAVDTLPVDSATLDPARPDASRGALDCGSIRKQLASVVDAAAAGEAGKARQWLERSGREVEYRRRAREHRAVRIAQEAVAVAERASNATR